MSFNKIERVTGYEILDKSMIATTVQEQSSKCAAQHNDSEDSDEAETAIDGVELSES